MARASHMKHFGFVRVVMFQEQTSFQTMHPVEHVLESHHNHQ
jgi:hypothetical protein